MDLLILRTWDGSFPMSPKIRPQASGPDFFRLALSGGPTLLYTTFSNRPNDPGFVEDAKWQMYPSQVPGTRLDPQTGATDKNTLGYGYPWTGPDTFYPMDAIYHLHFVIPHAASQLTLELGAMNLSNAIDENWGVANLQVRPLAEPEERPDAAAIAAAFAHAIDTTFADQPAAFQTLISGMDDTAEWIAANVQPQTVDAPKIAATIPKMAGDDHDANGHEAAFQDLHTLGPLAEPYLRDARGTANTDLRLRIDWLLQSIGITEIPDENTRRVLLATRILEIIGTPAALDVRKHLTESN